jgi:protein phosphatase PTC1
MSYDHRATD